MSAQRIAAVLALACGLTPAGRALGQQTSPELVAILARSALPYQDSVQVVESALPAEWAARMPLPSGMRFLGAVVGRAAATAYLVSAGSPSAARGLARAAAQSAGFVDAPEPPAPPGGFASQRPAGGSGPLCRGTTEELRIRTRPQLTGTLVTVEYVSGASYECAPSRPNRPDPFAALPKLQAPPLPAGLSPASCSGGRSSSTGGTRLVSALDPAGVLGFYGGQLEAAGWRRLPGDPSATGTWQKVGGRDTARVTLVVTGPTGAAGGCRRVELELQENYLPR